LTFKKKLCAFMINYEEMTSFVEPTLWLTLKKKIGLACVTKTMDLVGHTDEQMMDDKKIHHEYWIFKNLAFGHELSN
jgi:hypothetical protein